MELAPVLTPQAWHLFRVRPDNHPRRRIAGMAHLLDRVWDQGLLPALARAVQEGEVAGVRGILTVPAAGGQHGGRQAAYIGPGRAGEMAVNVLLPFCAASASATGDDALGAAAWALYRAWPPLPENEITREMTARLEASPGAKAPRRNGARRQQGLMHLYRKRLAPGSAGHSS